MKQRMWAIIDPVWHSFWLVRETRRAAQWDFRLLTGDSWKKSYRKGWRCVRVTVETEAAHAQD
jgi:hypothetical protein